MGVEDLILSSLVAYIMAMGLLSMLWEIKK
jgi:hypothetical protein